MTGSAPVSVTACENALASRRIRYEAAQIWEIASSQPLAGNSSMFLYSLTNLFHSSIISASGPKVSGPLARFAVFEIFVSRIARTRTNSAATSREWIGVVGCVGVILRGKAT